MSSFAITPDVMSKCRTELGKYFPPKSSIATRLEAKIFEYSRGNANIYEEKFIQLVSNLKINYENLKTIPLDMLVQMDDFGLGQNSSSQSVQINKDEEKINQLIEKHQEDDKKFEATLSFGVFMKCAKCGSEDVEWNQKQTRGGDESMTVFCTCKKCFNNWKY